MAFKAAKILLLINALAGFQPAPKLECGSYRVTATLHHKQGRFLLRMREHSRSPLELILLGAKVTDALDRVDASISVEVEVRKPINGNDRPFVHFKKWIEPTEDQEGIKLTEKQSCS